MKKIATLIAAFIVLAANAQNKTIYLNSKTETCNVKGIKKGMSAIQSR